MLSTNTVSKRLQLIDFDILRGFNVTREQLNHLRVQLHNHLEFQDLHIMNFDTFILNYEHKGNDYSIVIDRDGVQRMPLHYLIPIAEASETHLLIDFKGVK